MTTINQPPSPEPEKPNLFKRLVNKVKSSPKTVATGVIAIAAFGSLGYWGTQVLVKKKLPPFLETEIGNFIQRPIDLGEMKGFSLGGIEFGKTVIPATAKDPDKVTVEGVKVGFNLIPVLFRRTLPLDVSLIQPDIYLEQEQNGEWINLDFLPPKQEDKEPLIYYDVDLDVEQADITAVPYQQNPIQGKVDGSGRLNQAKELIAYDLAANIEQAQASIQGETRLKTGSTNTKLLINNLALSRVSTFFPNLPVKFASGELNADLDVNIPSLKEIMAANLKGIVNLQNITGEATDLDTPVTAKSNLNLSGRNAQVRKTQATLGNITAQVAGQVNLDSGYDLNLNILPFSLAGLPSKLTQQLPVDLAGEVAAQLQLEGAIKEPKVIGQINNIQTITVNKTQFKQVIANFRADLAKVVLENLKLTPVVGGNVIAEGTIETNIQQALEENRDLKKIKMPLLFSFQADLPTQDLISPYYQLPPKVTVGKLQARGLVDGTVDNPQALVKWNIPQANANNLEDIAGTGEVTFADKKLALQGTKITYGDGQAEVTGEANLNNQQWQAQVDAEALNLTPFLTPFNQPNLNLNRPVAVETAQAKFNGRLDQLDVDRIQGTVDLDLNVDGGDVAVNSQLNSGQIKSKAVTNNIELNPFLTSLTVPASLQAGEINSSVKLKQLLALAKNPDLNSLTAQADLDLQVDGEAVAVNSQIASGKIQANANTSEINLNRFAPKLPLPVSVRSSQVSATGELKQLLTFAETPDLSTFDARVDAALYVADGVVNAIANLDNNQWQANLDADNISSQLLLNKFASQNLASVKVDNINAQAVLTGNIQPIIEQAKSIPIAVDELAVNSGVQKLNAQGNLILANITKNLDVANTNLNVAANLDFERLPIDQFLNARTQNNQLVAENVNFRGKADFKGQFLGKQLISAPNKPGNIDLTGNLRLLDFGFNDIAFEPVIAGKLGVKPGEAIALNLQGKEDIIAAGAVPCRAKNCRLPYLPTNLEIRQEDAEKPVIALGDRNNQQFSLDINNFPLELLNLTPAKALGVEGAITGTTTGEIDLNLYTLATRGDIQIANPGLSYVQANQLQANFNYEPERNIAEITTASLELGDSQYNLNAALDLQSGAIDGQLDIPEAYIQDALTTLRWFTIEDVVKLINIPDYASPAAVKPAPEKETVDQSIARKLNQLRRVNRQIQANAKARETGTIPTKLNIDGRYAGKIILGGTIQTPKADFRVSGTNWQWQPKQAYPNIIPPLGLVSEEAQFIPIPKLAIAGKLEGTTVNLEQAMIQFQEAAFSLKGRLSPEQTDAKFAIANLTIDNISNFVAIPVDLAGEINATGTLQGTPSQPEIAGQVAFTEGAYNGNVLPAKIAGDFNYDGSSLAFNTTAPDAIQVKAAVPYPIIPGKSDRLTANVNLDKEAFVFLDALSQNYLNWIGGEGNAQLQANARLDFNRKGIIYDLDAKGLVNLENANIAIKTPFFTEPFRGTGKITLDNQIVNVETLDGTFADTNISATGKLPILTAVKNLDNPLTVEIPQGDINIDQLYQGGIQGNVTVTGASLEPIVSGKVNLEDGEVSIPKTDTPTTQNVASLAPSETNTNNLASGAKALTKATTTKPKSSAQSRIITTLQDLQVNLKDFRLQQTPLYEFQVKGGLTLNGTADQPSNIRPKGKLTLTKADVDLLSSTFNVARERENTIIFTPQAGVFNPSLDIVLKTEITEVEEEDISLLEPESNEIPAPLSRANNADTITVFLNVLGETSEILPNLGQQNADCNIRPSDTPLVENNQYYSDKELNRLTQCFNKTALIGDDNNQNQIINSPAVALTSVPSRSQGELIGLFGKEFLAFADQVRNSSQAELFDLGVNQFVIAPIRRSVFYRIDDTVVGIAQQVGLDYLRVLPNFEGIVELDQDSSVRSTYNYALEEVRVQYERRF
jgi:autotransporter translocation and assembly factor TamB